MENTELIKGLRWCADESICCDDFSGEKCPYFDEKKDSCSVDEILHAAADALEAAEKRIAELEAQNELKDGTITAMATDIGKLRAQMPKEGEWIDIDGTMFAECSVCGKRHYGCTTPYCDMCGAKMDGERKDNETKLKGDNHEKELY